MTGHEFLTFSADTDNLTHVSLDSNKIEVHQAFVDIQGDWKSLDFSLGEVVLDFGRPLKITLDRAYSKGEKFILKIVFETSPEASALQWLTKEQTSGKNYPFLFSQCQAIHARSFIPCQDTPSIKFTYNAEITVPKGLVSLMSASRLGSTENDNSTVYKFEQKMPIPSYLFALFVGDIESRAIGPRSHIWAERDLVEIAAEEFSDTEKFISTAESIAGPYEWGFYDLLVLPPSFPFGGMENPNVTTVCNNQFTNNLIEV